MGLNVIWLVVLRKNHSPLLCWVDVEKHLLPSFFCTTKLIPKNLFVLCQEWQYSYVNSKGGPNVDKLKVQKVY